MLYRVLLVEDSDALRETVTDIFESKGAGIMTIDAAADGNQGNELIRNNDYDLVMLDIMLPGMSGYDLCKILRAKSTCPIIFITALGEEDDALYGYKLGCDDYISKPFRIAELYAKAEAMLRRSKGLVGGGQKPQ